MVEDEDRLLKPNWWSLAAAWQQWKSYCCVEWNGDHIWLLDLDGPDEDSTTYVRCDYCHILPSEIYGDFETYGTVHAEGIEIEISDGRHYPADITMQDIPVQLKLEVEEHGWEYKEYDVWLTLSDRV